MRIVAPRTAFLRGARHDPNCASIIVKGGDPAHAESGFNYLVSDDLSILPAPWFSLTILNDLRCELPQFRLGAHLLQARSKGPDPSLQCPGNLIETNEHAGEFREW